MRFAKKISISINTIFLFIISKFFNALIVITNLITIINFFETHYFSRTFQQTAISNNYYTHCVNHLRAYKYINFEFRIRIRPYRYYGKCAVVRIIFSLRIEHIVVTIKCIQMIFVCIYIYKIRLSLDLYAI